MCSAYSGVVRKRLLVPIILLKQRSCEERMSPGAWGLDAASCGGDSGGSSSGHLSHTPDENLAGLGPIGRAHHAIALHALDHARRSVVSNAHLALQHGDGD